MKEKKKKKIKRGKIEQNKKKQKKGMITALFFPN